MRASRDVPGHFGPDVAASYDESSGSMFGADVLGRTFDVLAELAGDGAAVEFAVGTGRVGQPLPVGRSRRSVSGIDLSTAMAERLHGPDGLGSRLAGMVLRLRLRDCWAGWDRSAFTGDSTPHVSVWQRTDAGVG